MAKKTKQIKPQRGRPRLNRPGLERLKRAGVFGPAEAKRCGVSGSALQRLVAGRVIERIGRGLYLHAESSLEPAARDFAVACARFGPAAVIGGVTALFHYGLIEQVPRQIWVLVPSARKTNARFYRCLRTRTDLRTGVIDRGSYRITNVERSVVEALKYSSKIGLRTVLRAARTALLTRQTDEVRLLRQARELGLERYIKKHWDAILPETSGAA
jgi:predicted transcriptional regulator of viral defense system